MIATKANPFGSADDHLAPEVRDAVLKGINEAGITEILAASEGEVQSLLSALGS